MVRSHPLCPLSYGRASHAQIERKTGFRLDYSVRRAEKFDASSEPRRRLATVQSTSSSPAMVTRGDLAANVASFARHLRAENLSPALVGGG